VDKYLIVILMFLIAGVGIVITQKNPFWPMFYAMIAGMIIIFLYNSLHGRKERRELNRKRRKSKK
jgi:hypothetical protein